VRVHWLGSDESAVENAREIGFHRSGGSAESVDQFHVQEGEFSVHAREIVDHRTNVIFPIFTSTQKLYYGVGTNEEKIFTILAICDEVINKFNKEVLGEMFHSIESKTPKLKTID
jgi:hypothetical protein